MLNLPEKGNSFRGTLQVLDLNQQFAYWALIYRISNFVEAKINSVSNLKTGILLAEGHNLLSHAKEISPTFSYLNNILVPGNVKNRW